MHSACGNLTNCLTQTLTGAKPPKKEYINYKDLMQKRKQEKKKAEDEKQTMRSKGIMQRGGKKKKSGNDVGHFLDGYGKVSFLINTTAVKQTATLILKLSICRLVL